VSLLVQDDLASALSLAEAGDVVGADALAANATTIRPADPLAWALRATLVRSSSRYAESMAWAERAVALAPKDLAYRQLAAEAAIAAGDWSRARAQAEVILVATPFDQQALCHLAHVAARQGEPSGGGLLDLDDLVRVFKPSLPATFDAELLRNLALRSRDMCEVRGGTLVGGVRLNDTFALGSATGRPLEAAISAAKTGYLAALGAPPHHPVRIGEPASQVVVTWTNVMPAGAFERPHIHRSGWLSGVYYAEMPALDATDEAAAIVFGGHPRDEDPRDDTPRRFVHPRAGQLVLFPSYLTHRTRPFHGTGRRVSVAFDIQGV
jgi:tetratricopeptide (TPR) repeat protein